MFKKIFTGYLLIGLFALMLFLSVPTSSIDSAARKSRLNSNDNVSTFSLVPEPIQNEKFPFVSEFSSVYDLVYCNYFYVPREDNSPVTTYFCLYFFPYFNNQNEIEWSLGLSSIKVNPFDISFPIITDLAYSYLDLDSIFDFSNDFWITSFYVSLPYLNDQESFEVEFEFEFSNSIGSYFYLYPFFDDFYQYNETCDLGIPRGSFTTQIRYFDDNYVLPIGYDSCYYPVSPFVYNSTGNAIKAVSDYQQYQRGYDVGYDSGYDLGYDEGYDLGYEKGENLGYNNGYDVGYDNGYNIGLETGLLNNTANVIAPSNIDFIYFDFHYPESQLYLQGEELTDFLNLTFSNGAFNLKPYMPTLYNYVKNNENIPDMVAMEQFEIVFNFKYNIDSKNIDLVVSNIETIEFYDISNSYSYDIIDYSLSNPPVNYNFKLDLENLSIFAISFTTNLNFNFDTQNQFIDGNVIPVIKNTFISQYDSGYNSGYSKGVNESKDKINELNEEIKQQDKDIAYLNDRLNSLTNGDDFTLANLFWSIGSVPFETIKSIWNFEFLGVNLTQFFTGLITCLLLIYLIKKLFFK